MSDIITKAMIRGMKPAVYTAVRYGKPRAGRKGKIEFVCWPAAKFPGRRGVVVLKKVQCRTAEIALARAQIEILKFQTPKRKA